MTNETIFARREAAVPRGVGNSTRVIAARAANAEIWDVEGRRYIDFASGIAVLNTGHCHPRVIAAVHDQVDRFTHTAFQVMAYEGYIKLAERLNAVAPFTGPAKTIFFTTGAEAAENAVKIARAATGRPGIIAFSGGFHGRTMLTMALTGKTQPYKRRFGPMPGGIFHAPFPIDHYGVSVADSIGAIENIFRADIEAEQVAAIMIEPVQGEGGFHAAPAALLTALRRLCDDHGILLIDDEVQAGFARTGRMFGIEHSEVEPDLVAVAKALAGGFPLAGVIGRAELMDAAEPGGLGGTYAGSPVACAAALAVLDVIEDERLCARATAQGEKLRAALVAFSQRNDLRPIGAVRGTGAMIAFDVVHDRGGHRHDGAGARALVARGLEEGLILLSCGIFGETIRLLAPLTTPDEHLDEGLRMLERALAA